MTSKSLEIKLPHQRSAEDAYLATVQPNVETAPPQEPAGPIASRIEDDNDEPILTGGKMVEKTRKVTGELPDSLHKKLKRGLVDREDMTINDVIVKAVERYIRNW